MKQHLSNHVPLTRTAGTLTVLGALGLALTGFAGAEKQSGGITFSQIGTKAAADYHGDALASTGTAEGARLRCGFQKLDMGFPFISRAHEAGDYFLNRVRLWFRHFPKSQRTEEVCRFRNVSNHKTNVIQSNSHLSSPVFVSSPVILHLASTLVRTSCLLQ